MARTLTDEDIRLNLIINGNEAQKELGNLEKETRKLTESNKQLGLEKKRLELAGKKETAEYKRITAEMKANNVAITENKNKMKQLQQQIGINGLTMKQLTERANTLKLALRNAIPGTEAFARYNAELRQIGARLSELRGQAVATRMSIGSIADGFNRYQTLAFSVIAAITGVVLSIQKLIDINAKLSDAQSDVMKTTGMTKKEVDELTKSFGALKTRTARIELLELATEAGRLGITGVENVRAFTEQANKMKVALGDDLSTEQIREVGKMVNVYKVGEATGKDFAGAMDALGSSINEVAASGANQAGFLVDYLKRQAGISAQTKLSAADNVGYAATFDEIGQSVEVSATAMNKVWMDMFKQPEQYAQIARMGVGEFKKLMEEDANEAMIRFLEGLNGNQKGLEIMLEKLKDLEVGGARGVQAISALANNTKLLRDRQVISNQAMEESTSLTDEYNLKNTNLAATVEKIKKTMMGWFSSETIVSGLSDFFSWFAKLIGATEDLDGSVTRFRDRLIVFLKVLTIVILSYISYNAALKLTLYWTRTVAAAQSVLNLIQGKGALAANMLRGAQILLSAAYNLVTGNITRATAAMRLFNTVTKMNPLGLLFGLIASVTTALVVFKKRTEEAYIAQKTLSDVRLTAARTIETEKQKLNELLKIARDETISKERRQDAIKKLNELSPEYLGNLTLETIKTGEATKAINLYISALEKKAMQEAFTTKRAEIQAKKLDALLDEERSGKFKKVYEAEQKLLQQMTEEERKLWFSRSALSVQETEQKHQAILRAKESLNDEERKHIAAIQFMSANEKDLYRDYKRPIGEAIIALRALSEEEKKFMEQNKGLYLPTDSGVEPDSTGTNTGEDPNAKINKLIQEYERLATERAKAEREAEDAILANMEEGYRKQWQMEQSNHTRKIQDLKDRLIEESEIEKAELMSRNMNLSAEDRDIWRKKAILQKEQNRFIFSMLESEETAHQLRLERIRENAAKKSMEDLDKQHELAKAIREEDFYNYLSTLKLNEDERKRMIDDFRNQELIAEEDYLFKKIETLNEIIAGAEINGIDYSLISEEERANLERNLEFLRAALAKVREEVNALKGGGSQGTDFNILQGMGTDVLGFSPEQWTMTFSNLETLGQKIQATEMILSAVQNAWGQFGDMLFRTSEAEIQNLDRKNATKKRKLKQDLDNGLINQVQYRRALEKLDTDSEKKRAEFEYKKAKRDRIVAVANIASNTAMGIMKAVAASPLTGGMPWTAIIGALGALNIANVLRQPLPTKGFEDGLYPDYVTREQDGKRFRTSGSPKPMNRSGLYNKPTILVGEGPGDMPELIVDKQAFARINPEVRNAFIRELRTVKGLEGGYYDNTGTVQIPPSGNDDSKYEALLSMMTAVVAENTEAIRELRENGVIGKFLRDDIPSMKNLDEAMKRYEELKRKSRK